MDKIRIKPKDKELSAAFKSIEDNALGNPIVFESEPNSTEMKANTIGKVKDATDFVFIKFADGKCVKVPVSEVT